MSLTNLFVVFSPCRYGATRAVVVAITCTFFEFFNIPVFWPILVMYFIVLFVITMKRQIKVSQKRNMFRNLTILHKLTNELDIKITSSGILSKFHKPLGKCNLVIYTVEFLCFSKTQTQAQIICS